MPSHSRHILVLMHMPTLRDVTLMSNEHLTADVTPVMTDRATQLTLKPCTGHRHQSQHGRAAVDARLELCDQVVVGIGAVAVLR